MRDTAPRPLHLAAIDGLTDIAPVEPTVHRLDSFDSSTRAVA